MKYLTREMNYASEMDEVTKILYFCKLSWKISITFQEQAVIDKVFNEMSQKMKEKFAVLKKKTAEAEKEIQKVSKLMDDEDLKIRKNMEVINASSVSLILFLCLSSIRNDA